MPHGLMFLMSRQRYEAGALCQGVARARGQDARRGRNQEERARGAGEAVSGWGAGVSG